MQKYPVITALGFQPSGLWPRAIPQGCGELHYARLAGGGHLAYCCRDESCWLRKPAASEGEACIGLQWRRGAREAASSPHRKALPLPFAGFPAPELLGGAAGESGARGGIESAAGRFEGWLAPARVHLQVRVAAQLRERH